MLQKIDSSVTVPSKPKPKKRRYGSGSYIELPKKGLWAYSFSLGTGADGRRKRVTIYGRTKAECKQQFEDERARHGGTLVPPSPETVQGYIDAWLENLKLRKKLTTTSTYEAVLKYVKPLLGTVKLTRFDSASAQRLYAALHAKGVTPSVLEKIHIALHACLNTAVKSGKIIRNPSRGLHQPYWDTSSVIPAGGLQPKASSESLPLRFVLANFKPNAVPPSTFGDAVSMLVRLYVLHSGD
jgi:hypothetical protein